MAEKQTPKNQATNKGGPRMSIGDHLNELRQRVVRACIAVAVVFFASWVFIDEVMKFLLRPHYIAMEAVQEEVDRRSLRELMSPLFQKETDKGNLEMLRALQGTIDEEETVQEAFEAARLKYKEIHQQTFLQSLEEQFENLPNRHVDRKPIVTGPTESIATYLKASLIISLLIAGPYVLWQLWGFISAGLLPREKSFMRLNFPFALILFFAGLSFGYLVLIPFAFSFLATWGLEIVRPEYKLSDYFSVFTLMTLLLGIIFQIPVVMVLLSRLGIVQPSSYRGKWKYVLVGCFILAAIVTPTPDPLNQSMVAATMYCLYELGYLLSKMAYRKRQEQLEETS